jgi:hypothetical protein
VASKRHQRRKECGKTAFADDVAAANAVWAAQQRGQRVSAYRCRWCQQFPIGHTPKRVRQAMAALARARRESA